MALCESGMTPWVSRVSTRDTINLRDTDGRNALLYALDDPSSARLRTLKVLLLKGIDWSCASHSGVS
jgi:hypothetical protein